MSNVDAEGGAPTGATRAPPQHHPGADHPNGSEDKFERFERWLRENGAYFPEVSTWVLTSCDMTRLMWFSTLRLCHHWTCRNLLARITNAYMLLIAFLIFL